MSWFSASMSVFSLSILWNWKKIENKYQTTVKDKLPLIVKVVCVVAIHVVTHLGRKHAFKVRFCSFSENLVIIIFSSSFA